MKYPTYRPYGRKILRDVVIVSILMLMSILIGPALVAQRVPIILFGIVLLMGLYYFIMGVLPYIRITADDELEYRSDYGVTRRIKLGDIDKITKGSGLGGYEHALFVYHFKAGQLRTNKIKSSYFKREDVIDLISEVRKRVQIQTNPELEDYLAGRKTKYS